jgi:hypothetical protein
MKMRSLTQLLTAGAISLTSLMVGIQPSQAQATFVCEFSSTTNLYTTYAQTPRGPVPVVRWYSHYFEGAGYTPERRCREVSGRFQNLQNQGLLPYITAGYLNGQPVICAGSGGGCNSSNLLFTLKAGSDAAAVLQELFDLRSGASASPLYQSSGGGGAPTIDMNQYLNNAPVENGGGGASQPAPSQEAPATSEPAPSEPASGGGSLW